MRMAIHTRSYHLPLSENETVSKYAIIIPMAEPCVQIAESILYQGWDRGEKGRVQKEMERYAIMNLLNKERLMQETRT